MPVRKFIGDEENYQYYNYKQGAYVFTITTSGFELRGEVTHEDNEEGEGSWWYNSPSAVKRSLYMDDILYTISDKLIKANNINTIEEIETVELGYIEPKNDDKYEIYY